MKKILFFILLSPFLLNAQNIGIGTTTPTEKLDIKGNINIGGTIKAAGVTGSTGQVLSATGTGLAWVNGIYTINSTNYTSVTVPANNYVRIDGTITLSGNFSGLNQKQLTVNGGTIQGNGGYVLSIGQYCVFNGVTFFDVDIDCPYGNTTFINCIFYGNCPRLGNNCEYRNCFLGGITTSGTTTLGVVSNSNISNCALSKCSDFLNCQISNCTLGNGATNACSIKNISNSYLTGCSIYALQWDLIFNGNNCSNTSIFLSNSNQACGNATISNNLFSGSLNSTTSTVNIDPTNSGYKFYTIAGNSFSNSNKYSIEFTSSTNGNSYNYTSISIKNNTFFKGVGTYPIFYQSSVNVDYTGNTVFGLSQPSSSGNLVVKEPNFTH